MSSAVDYPSKDLRLVVALTALAGAVDAIGFLKLGGLYVASMGGTSTQAAVAWILLDGTQLRLALTLVGLFVGGAVAAGVVGWAAGPRRRAVILWLVTALLAAAFGAARAERVGFGVCLLALAMGSQSAVLPANTPLGLHPTQVTGALARLGQGLAAALTREADPRAWTPHLLQWLGFVVGGGVGALAYAHCGLTSLAAPVLFAAVLALGETGRPAPATVGAP